MEILPSADLTLEENTNILNWMSWKPALPGSDSHHGAHKARQPRLFSGLSCWYVTRTVTLSLFGVIRRMTQAWIVSWKHAHRSTGSSGRCRDSWSPWSLFLLCRKPWGVVAVGFVNTALWLIESLCNTVTKGMNRMRLASAVLVLLAQGHWVWKGKKKDFSNTLILATLSVS